MRHVVAHHIVYKALDCRICYAQLYIFLGEPFDMSRFLLLVEMARFRIVVEYRSWLGRPG